MGMFDNVQVEFELEDCANPELENWQTKDFDCSLDTYVLTHSGHIVGPLGLMNYSGTFRIVAYKQPAYEITYEQGILQSVEKINRRH